MGQKKVKNADAGLSISTSKIELAVFKLGKDGRPEIASSISVPTPAGLFDAEGDRIMDEGLLKDTLAHLLSQVKPRPVKINLSVPTTLLRMIEMPKVGDKELFMSLSSEAEQYKPFDGTEAAVDFVDIPELTSPRFRTVVFAALRQDTVQSYQRVAKALKLQLLRIGLEPLDVLRGLAATGVLNSLVEQIGPDTYWGTIFAESRRVRLSLWKGDKAVEFRETSMDTSEFYSASDASMCVEDMLEEIRRTTKQNHVPIWLTYNTPASFDAILTNRLGARVMGAMVGDAFPMDNRNLTLATVGAAVGPYVPFPFLLNVLKGAGSVPGNVAAADVGGGSDAGGGGGNEDSLMAIGGVALVVCLLLSGAAWGLNEFMMKPKVTELQATVDGLTASVADLEKQKNELSGNSMASMTPDEIKKAAIRDAKIRNHIYVSLAKDLRAKAPSRLWIQEVTAGDAIQFQGKALSHQAVIDFAQKFDQAPYMSNVKINGIQEEMLGGTSLFNYTIQGGISITPEALSDGVPTDAEVKTPPEPGAAAAPKGAH